MGVFVGLCQSGRSEAVGLGDVEWNWRLLVVLNRILLTALRLIHVDLIAKPSSRLFLAQPRTDKPPCLGKMKQLGTWDTAPVICSDVFNQQRLCLSTFMRPRRSQKRRRNTARQQNCARATEAREYCCEFSKEFGHMKRRLRPPWNNSRDWTLCTQCDVLNAPKDALGVNYNHVIPRGQIVWVFLRGICETSKYSVVQSQSV